MPFSSVLQKRGVPPHLVQGLVILQVLVCTSAAIVRDEDIGRTRADELGHARKHLDDQVPVLCWPVEQPVVPFELERSTVCGA